MRSFAAETPVGLSEDFVDLPIIGIQFIPEIIPRVHFGLFHLEGCGFSHRSVPQMQRIFGFVMKPCLVVYFLCLNSLFHFLVPPRGYFIAIIRHTESFPFTYPSWRWSCSWFEQLRLHLCVRCAFRDFSGQEQYAACLQRSFLHLYPPGPRCLNFRALIHCHFSFFFV